MSTLTPNFQWILPSPNDPTDQDLWGGYLNSNISSQDGIVFAALNFVHSDETASFNVTTSDYKKLFLCDATGGAITVSLPAASTVYDGFTIAVKRTNSGANAVTIDGDGSETIDGATTYALSSQYDYVIIVCDGTEWHIVSRLTSLNNAALTGTPTAPTAAFGTDTTQIATTAFVQDAIPIKRKWAFSVSGGVLSVLKNEGFSSISRTSDGQYAFVFTDPTDDEYYHVSAMPMDSNGPDVAYKLSTVPTVNGFSLSTGILGSTFTDTPYMSGCVIT